MRNPLRPLLPTALMLLVAAGPPAAAVICTLDAVPGATLLLPYFEVDLHDPNGLTTLFAVNNAKAEAVLAHVTLWTDLSVPVLQFDIYLTGYDMQTVNLRDILIDGRLPQTASAGQDPTDQVSPKGFFSRDINFASCDGILPPPALPSSLVNTLQLQLTGRPAADSPPRCFAQLIGDGVARGYITVDTVSRCTIRVPSDPGYFAAGGTGDATNQNQLFGTWFIVNSRQNYSAGSDLVSIEADAANPATSTAGHYTFYGRFVGWSAIDNREPLATTFGSQYLSGGGLLTATDMIVWRDPKKVETSFSCPAVRGDPTWFPLSQEGVVLFDEQEQAAVPMSTFPWTPVDLFGFVPFAAATQRVRVGAAALPVPFSFGWMDLDLSTPPTSVFQLGSQPPIDPMAQQAYVVAVFTSNGHFAVTADAFRLDSACAAAHMTFGP